MLAYTSYMYLMIKQSLAYLAIVCFCFYGTLSSAQEKEEDPAIEEKDAVVIENTKPVRIPSSQQRQQFPSNNGSDSGQMDALAKQIPMSLSPLLSRDAAVWLETAANERFLGLWQADRSGNPLGALLIIHSEGENLAWPDTTIPLHETLPDYGWATLALSLPEPTQSPTPKRTLPIKTRRIPKADSQDEPKENKEKEKNKESETMIAEEKKLGNDEIKNAMAAKIDTPKMADKEPNRVLPEATTEQRLEAALRFLHDRGQFNIVILGNGIGAIRANTFLNNTTPTIDDESLGDAKPFRAMVLLNSRNRLPTMKQDYNDWFSDPEIPVLDIFLDSDPRNQIAARNRRIIAKQRKLVTYKQVKLSHLNHTQTGRENILSRRIRGYLNVNAIGVEANIIDEGAVN